MLITNIIYHYPNLLRIGASIKYYQTIYCDFDVEKSKSYLKKKWEKTLKKRKEMIEVMNT